MISRLKLQPCFLRLFKNIVPLIRIISPSQRAQIRPYPQEERISFASAARDIRALYNSNTVYPQEVVTLDSSAYRRYSHQVYQ